MEKSKATLQLPYGTKIQNLIEIDKEEYVELIKNKKNVYLVGILDHAREYYYKKE